MNWQEAFLAQAKSDYSVFKLLNEKQAPLCHKLHYLQMASEKLAKSFMCDQKGNPPTATHQAIVRFLKIMKSNRAYRNQLQYSHNTNAFSAWVDSILPLAESIQNMAPAGSGFDQVNSEYPWEISPGAVIPPCQHSFSNFDAPSIIRFQGLIESLIRIAT